MRTHKAVVGYKALTQDFTGIHGTDFSVGSISELPDCRPQAGKHGYTFATSLSRLFQCFDTNELPIVVEVVGYGETHIGRHLCATNHLFVTRVVGFHEIQETLNQERQNRNTPPVPEKVEPEEVSEEQEKPEDRPEEEPAENSSETSAPESQEIAISDSALLAEQKKPSCPVSERKPSRPEHQSLLARLLTRKARK